MKEVVTVCSNVCEWGKWYPYENCTDPQAFAIGFNAKIQPNQGPKDDSSLNGIAFLCGYRNGTTGKTINSGVGQWGQWDQPTPLKCSVGSFITGFQMIYEPSCGICDDTAAGGIRVQCSDGNAMEGRNMHQGQGYHTLMIPSRAA